MKQRTITAIIFVLILLPLIIIGGPILKIASLLLAYLSLREFLRMDNKDQKPSFLTFLSYVGITVLVLKDDLIRLFPLLTLERYLIILVLLELVAATTNRDVGYDNAAMSLMGILYLGYGFYSLHSIRSLSLAIILFIIISVWVSDSGALIFGKMFGKTKLAPLLSPNKTIEGAIGGVVSAGIVGLVFSFLPFFHYRILYSVLLAMLVSAAGQFGDLIESGLKRQFNVKDSGSFFPGHGGILDRFDSLIFALSLAMLIINI